MKKIISILLTAVMLCSLFTVNVAADSLDVSEYEALELKLFEDIFLSYDEFRANIHNQTLADDSFYRFKGLAYDSNLGVGDIKYPLGVSASSSTFAMVIKDTATPRYERTVETTAQEGNLTLKADGRYDFKVGDTIYHLGKIAEGEKNGNVFFPGQPYDTSVLNEVIDSDIYTVNGGVVDNATYPVNKDGLKSINLLSTSFVCKQLKVGSTAGTGIWTNQTDSEIMPITVQYEDSEETYYIANGSVYLDFPYSIRVVDKEKAIDGLTSPSTNFFDLTYTKDNTSVPTGNDETIGVEFLGKIFKLNGKKIIMPSASSPLANVTRISQVFKNNDGYSRYSAGHGYLYSYEIPVNEGKRVLSITVDEPLSLSEAGFKELFGNNVVGSNGTYIKFASDDTKDYYLSVYSKYSTTTDSDFSALFGITLKYKSYAEKIAEVNELIDALSESTVTPMKIAEIEDIISQLKSENSNINDSYFNIEKINQMKNYLKSQVSEKIDEFKNDVNALERYTLEVKELLMSIKENYDFLVDTGVTDEEIGEEIVAKFKTIYKQYEDAEKFEEKVENWDVYSFTMYNDVVSSKEKLEDFSGMISQKTFDKVESYYAIAQVAKSLDDKIESFGDSYDETKLDELLLLEIEINEFIAKENKGALENIADFEKLLKDASEDVLNKDIILIEGKISELPDLYSTAIKEALDEIVCEIASVEERGGQISVQLKGKINKLIAQMNEEPLYIMMDLDYTRDVFESMDKYALQALFNEEDNTYTYPTGSWGLTVNAINATTKRAFAEEEFVSKLNLNSDNKTTIDSVPYQFGKVISDVNGSENEPNSIFSGDCIGEIKIDVTDAPYSELYLAAWSGLTNNVEAEITYHYSDGSKETDVNITKIKGGTTVPKLDDYTKALYNGSIRMWRASNGTDRYGAYNGVVISHKLMPDDTKMLTDITVKTSGKEVNIFALTGKAANSGIMNVSLDETMTRLENTEDAKEIRELISVAEKLMSLITQKGGSVSAQYYSTISQLKEKYIEVDTVECYTDVDYRNITVTFTGEIADEYFTNQYFKVTKDGKPIDNYTVLKVSGKEAAIKFVNKFDYESIYALEINKDIMNKEKSISLDTPYNKLYDGLKAIEADLSYSGGSVKASIKNNTKDKQNVTVLINSYDDFNSLVGFELIEKELGSGEEIYENIVFNANGGKVQCVITDTINNAKLLYNEINLQKGVVIN